MLYVFIFDILPREIQNSYRGTLLKRFCMNKIWLKVQNIGRQNILVFVLFSLFVYFALDFFISFNWNQSRLTETYPFDVGKRHYLDHVDSYLNLNVGKINTHVLLALAMLVFGILQFSNKLRTRFPQIHKFCGYSYYFFGLLAVGIGTYLSDKTLGGVTAQISNYTAALWLLSSSLALRNIVRKNIPKHRFWSYRSYIVGASTGLIRPVEFIIDKLFPAQTTSVLFGVASFVSLVLALIAWIFVTDSSNRSN